MPLGESIQTTTALCASLPLAAGGGAPEWVQLMPRPADGRLEAADGRKWHLGDAAKVVAASGRPGVDLVFDYEHQTHLATENGQPAPAAGWIKELQARQDGIWARVEWTDKARRMIEAREYRYLSPTFSHAKDGEVLQILSAALTNDPALQVRALASRQPDPRPTDPSPNGDETMDKQQLAALCKALGLKEDAQPDAIVKAASDQAAAVKTAQEAAETAKAKAEPGGAKAGEDGGAQAATGAALASIAKAAGLAEDAEPEAVATAVAGRLKPGASVPAEQYNALAKRLDTLEGERSTEKAEEAVEAAVRAGKVVPSQRDWALGYAKADPEGFAAFCKAQPAIVKPGSEITGRPPRETGGPLDQAQVALCRQLGLDQEAYKKTLDAEAKAAEAREQEIA
jgi:phage I-like protein